MGRLLYRTFCYGGLLSAFVRLALGASSLESGAYFTAQFGPKIYDASPQNWAAVQDRRGVLFFGNTDGVLEFDGASWRHISLGGLPALSLAFDPAGTLFAGSENDFGYLAANDGSGSLHFVSLAKRLTARTRPLGNIRSIACLRDEVVFTAPDHLYRWNSKTKELTALYAPGALRSLVIDSAIYVLLRPSGVKRFDGTGLQDAPELEPLPPKPLRWITRFHGNIIFASGDELYRQQGGKVAKWDTQAAALLRNSLPGAMLPLHNGLLAIATARAGALLIDNGGRLDHAVDRRAGLRSDAVSALFEDRQNGLWLALDRGLARAEVESPLTGFGEAENIGEMVNATTRFAGSLYAGTAVGLSRLIPGAYGELPSFEPVAGTPDHVVTLLPRDDALLTGGAGGVYQVAHGQTRLVLKTTAIYDLAASTDGKSVYAAGSSGLYVLTKEDRTWRVQSRVEGPEWRTVVAESPTSVWVTGRSAICHVDFVTQTPSVETFGKNEGVPGGWVNAYRVGSRILFATTDGIRRFYAGKRVFVRDASLGADFADGSAKVSLMRDGKDGQIWISGDGYHTLLIPQGDGSYRRRNEPLARAGIQELYSLYIDNDDGTIWASGMDGGLVRCSRSSFDTPHATDMLLRRVESLKTKTDIAERSASSAPRRIAYHDNALRFEFALPDFEDTTRTEYQVWLKGLDRDWSAWSTAAEKEYTNLFEKEYMLLARARNFNGVVSEPVQFRFRVLPPWYRTWWSYLLYAAMLMAGIGLLIRYRIRHLAAQNRKLEKIVNSRTARIREQRDQIVEKERETTSLLLNILPPQIADELRMTGKVEPITCRNVAVCFTDFVGFTRACEQMTAQELVAALHAYFGAFDDVISRYKMEKLKTIGDSYMFVGGLPKARNGAALDTVLAALELTKTVERLGEMPGNVAWKIRVGVHSGPAVAGIVGSKKFAYDIWGATVNLASRMENAAAPNTVNISADLYEGIKDFVDCESRGLVKTKEGRDVEMYFARQLKPELAGNMGMFAALYRERFGEEPPVIDTQALGAAMEQSLVSD